MKIDGLELASVPIGEICGKNHERHSGAAALHSVICGKNVFPKSE